MALTSGVTILYGSETGNAQDFAHHLGRKLRYCSLSPVVSSLDDYPLKRLVTDSRFLIVLCSTTGQGELPRNATKFMKFLLKRKLPADLLNHLQISTFGIGDSSYPKFNHAIKKIHTRLLQLGCSEFSPRCESDEMSPEGVDGYYAEWVSTLVPALQAWFPKLTPVSELVLLPPEYVISIDRDLPSRDFSSVECGLTRSSLMLGTISENTRLTAIDHFQDVRHIVIESDVPLEYAPGDTLMLYPPNDDRSVDLLLQLQPHWLEVADNPLTISSEIDVEGGWIHPDKLTLRTLIKYHLDISSIPRRTFFGLLFHFVDDLTENGKREKEKLHDFSKLEESEDLYNYANRPRRLILETILEFEENLKIPIEYILDLLPLIKVRLFLIASKPSPKSIELLVGIVEYKTMLRRIRRGLCTKWLKNIEVGSKLVFSIHRSNLSFDKVLPLDHTKLSPVVMIAPGTGLAPMKSLIEHSLDRRDLYLFSGCRYKAKDHLFGDLWHTLETQKLLQLYPAFSRDDGFKWKYVQDRLFAEKTLIADLLTQKNAIVFLCGSSGKMPNQVRITLVEILRDVVESPEEYLLEMENCRRYIQETW